MLASATIARFLASLRRTRRWFGAGVAVLGPVLALLVGWLLAGLLPGLRPLGFDLRLWVMIVTAPWLLFELLRALRWQAQVVVELDHALELRDGLATWSSLVATPVHERPIFDWLEQDLERRIERLPARSVQTATRPRLGRARYLLPLLVLLLLLQQFAPLPPRIPSPGGPSIGGGGGGGGAGGGGGHNQPQPSPPAPLPPRQEPQPELPPQPEPEPPAEPKPLLQKPVEDQVVLPEFVQDGPTRRELAPVAELAGGGAAAASAGGARSPTPSPPGSPEFARAQEEALRSRHVPPPERPFVRSYFETLARRAR